MCKHVPNKFLNRKIQNSGKYLAVDQNFAGLVNLILYTPTTNI